MKVYIVVDCCGGVEYSTDDPTILFVGTSREKAETFFNNEIENWEDGLTDYEADVYELKDNIENTLFYEITDFESDTHRIMKLVCKEIE